MHIQPSSKNVIDLISLLERNNLDECLSLLPSISGIVMTEVKKEKNDSFLKYSLHGYTAEGDIFFTMHININSNTLSMSSCTCSLIGFSEIEAQPLLLSLPRNKNPIQFLQHLASYGEFCQGRSKLFENIENIHPFLVSSPSPSILNISNISTSAVKASFKLYPSFSTSQALVTPTWSLLSVPSDSCTCLG